MDFALLNDSWLRLDYYIDCHYKCWVPVIEAIIKKASCARQLFLCYYRAVGLGLGCPQHRLHVHIPKTSWKVRIQEMYRRRKQSEKTPIISSSPHTRELTSTQSYQLLVCLEEQSRGLFQPWWWHFNHEILLCFQVCGALETIFLLWNFVCSAAFLRAMALGDEAIYQQTISHFPPKWHRADVSYAITHRRQKKPLHASQLASVRWLGGFGFSGNVVFFFSTRMNEIT